MAGLPKSHGLVAGLALAVLLMAPGRAAGGYPEESASGKGTLGKVSRAGDHATLPTDSACDLGNRASMHSDGLQEAAFGGDESPLRFVGSDHDCDTGAGPRVWMQPGTEVADRLQAAEAPRPTSAASVVASVLAWTGVGLLISCWGPFMAWWWH